jgi:hypothetical protein
MRLVIAMLFALLGFARAADALTVRDLVELSRAGLGDEVLLALIEVNRGVYAIDPATLRTLKDAGVSDRVIAALIRSGREHPAPEPWAPADTIAPAATPPVVVIQHQAAPPPPAQTVAVPVPVYVPLPVSVRSPRHRPVPRVPAETTYVPFQSGPPAVRPTTPTPSSPPVYWGYGGKLRPDAWQPAGHKPDPRTAPKE